MFGVVDDSTTTKFANRACAVHGISLPVVVDKVVVVVLKFPNVSCKPFVSFVEETLVAHLRSGAISLLGRAGVVDPPFIVLPLTVEPTKPRLCHDARYLNLWMRDMPFSLDRLIDLPRYVGKDTYQTVLDDKSGYDHILLSEDSRTYFGIQWGGWYFTYNTLPFGWKISPFVYHTTGLLASNFLRAIGIPWRTAGGTR